MAKGAALGDPETEIAHSTIRNELLSEAGKGREAAGTSVRAGGKPVTTGAKQAAVSRLIQVYSLRGHQIADIDPLGLMDRQVPGDWEVWSYPREGFRVVFHDAYGLGDFREYARLPY